MKKKLLMVVTGGAGFLGSHLGEWLLSTEGRAANAGR